MCCLVVFQPVQIEGAPPLPQGPQRSADALDPVALDQQANRLVGGISVAESRDLLREADLIDRKVEKQRIKNKHKERRLKIKKRRREEQVIQVTTSVVLIMHPHPPLPRIDFEGRWARTPDPRITGECQISFPFPFPFPLWVFYNLFTCRVSRVRV